MPLHAIIRRCVVTVSLLLLACNEGDVGKADAGFAFDGGQGGQTRFCSKPTDGKYAFTMSVGHTKLYLVGDDGWAKELGELVVGPTHSPLQLESVTKHGALLEGTSGSFLFDIPTAVTDGNQITITQRAGYSSSNSYVAFNYFNTQTFIAANNRDVYCGTEGASFGLGLASILPCTKITAIRGTCTVVTGGDYQAKVIASCGGASRYVEIAQVGQVPTQVGISSDIAGRFRGLTSDSLSTDGTGDVYTISQSGATKRYTTKLCVDEFIDNPFNGSTLSLTEIVD